MERKYGMLEIRVRDNGAGISLADQKTKLFKSFEMLRAGKQSGGGSGLGLAICREIAKLQNGSVGCDSEEGKGATFWLKVEVNSSNNESRSEGKPNDVVVRAI